MAGFPACPSLPQLGFGVTAPVAWDDGVASGGGKLGWINLAATPVKRRVRVRLHAPEKSERSAPVVLYLHGTMNDVRSSMVAEHLALIAPTCRVLAPQHRDTDGQARPSGEGDGPTHPSTYADDALAAVDAVFGLETRFHVVGYSCGANVALWLAHRHPARVLRVACVAGGWFQARHHEFGGFESEKWPGIFGQDEPWVRALLDRSLAALLPHLDVRLIPWVQHCPDQVAPLQAGMDKDHALLWPTQEARAAARQGDLYFQLSQFVGGSPPQAALKALADRALLVSAKHDGMHKPARVEELAKRMPCVPLVWLDEGHDCVKTAIACHVLPFFVPKSALQRHAKSIAICLLVLCFACIPLSWLFHSGQEQTR